MLRTYQPKKLHRKKEHGFRKRMSDKNGRKVLARRRAKRQSTSFLLMMPFKGHLSVAFLCFAQFSERMWIWTSSFQSAGTMISEDSMRRGKSFVSPLVVVYVKKNRNQGLRVGITTSKKIGNAVLRNRSRRVIREAFRELSPRVKSGYDLVFVARGRTPHVKSTDVRRHMEKRADGGRSIETGGLFRAGKLEDDKTAVFTVDSVLPQGHLPEKACYVPLYSHLLGIWLGGH